MDNKLIGNEKNILFYNDEEGNTKVEVLLENEDVWLSVNAIATLFDVQRPAIVKHINNIFFFIYKYSIIVIVGGDSYDT